MTSIEFRDGIIKYSSERDSHPPIPAATFRLDLCPAASTNQLSTEPPVLYSPGISRNSLTQRGIKCTLVSGRCLFVKKDQHGFV